MSILKNMKISVRLLTGFVLVALIAAIVGVIGIVNINKIKELDESLYKTMTEPMGDLIAISESYQVICGNIKDIIMSETEAELNEYRNSLKAESDELDKCLENFKKTLFTAEGEDLINSIIKNKGQYILIAEKIIELVNNNEKEEARDFLYGNGEAVRKLVVNAINDIKQIKIDSARETSNNNIALALGSVSLMFLFISIGFAFSILAGIVISGSISKPIKQMVAVANKIADCDINVIIDFKSKDEIGILAQSFRKMTDNLNNIMHNIHTASEQVASGAKQVSESSIMLSQGATEQASSIEELSAAIEEIYSQTKHNAENATKANILAKEAKADANKGNEQMKEMLGAMDEINISSKNIKKIIKVIDDIAFQTNILSLNAAIEAARAGQHGRGFSVVAQEVRSLAARSSTAARETSEMIESSIKKIDFGTAITKESAASLIKIVEGVSTAASHLGDIAVASKEQATGVEQINQGIMQVSEVVQSNSSTSEESAAASKELTNQAEFLMEQVNKFKLRENNNSKFSEKSKTIIIENKEYRLVENNEINLKEDNDDIKIKLKEKNEIRLNEDKEVKPIKSNESKVNGNANKDSKDLKKIINEIKKSTDNKQNKDKKNINIKESIKELFGKLKK
ncbi:MAG: hypothetical protein K0S55_462 [Clostridia bacterium]|nr:hypothetical protein [Clostridia bacterium]